jgi:hypothetical protein
VRGDVTSLTLLGCFLADKQWVYHTSFGQYMNSCSYKTKFYF